MYEIRRVLCVTVADEDKRALQSLADRDQISVAEWVRRGINAQLHGLGEPALLMRRHEGRIHG